MTIPDALDYITRHVQAWHAEEVIALRRGDDERARDCRRSAAVLEQLASELQQKAAA